MLDRRIEKARVAQAVSALYFLGRKLDILQTFVGNLFCPNSAESAISKAIADKISGSGLSYQNLSSVYQTFGDAGIAGIWRSQLPATHTVFTIW